MSSTWFNTLTVIAFTKSLFQIKYRIFSIESSLLLLVSNVFLFVILWVSGNQSKMNLIRLYICAVTKNYFDKIVMNPGKGFCIKGEDKLHR